LAAIQKDIWISIQKYIRLSVAIQKDIRLSIQKYIRLSIVKYIRL
jgi:hypothetical protein